MAEKPPCGRPIGDKGKFSGKLWHSQFKQYVSSGGLKSSRVRDAVAEVVLSLPKHFNSTQVVEAVQKKDSKIGAATVYRTVKLLLDAGLIEETLRDGGGNVVFEVSNEGHHDHIICADCGHIFEFHDAKIETRQDALSRQLDFEPHGHRHVIYAHCKRLKQTSK